MFSGLVWADIRNTLLHPVQQKKETDGTQSQVHPFSGFIFIVTAVECKYNNVKHEMSTTTKISEISLVSYYNYIACACSSYNARPNWLTLGHYSPIIPQANYGLAKTKQKAI